MAHHIAAHTATATAIDTPAVRVTGPQGIVAAVPQVLGFEPHDSVVLLCLVGGGRRLGPVARIDIFPAAARDAADRLVAYARRYADAAILVCYHDGDRPGCLDVVVRALAARAIPVVAVLSVRSGLIRDARTSRSLRLDSGVAVLEPGDRQSQALAAAHALAGRRVLSDRCELVASIAAPGALGEEAVRRALSESRRAFASAFEAAPNPVTVTLPLSRAVDRAFARATAEVGASGDVALRAAADLIVLSTHVGCRDQLLARAVCSADRIVVPVLVAVARRCPNDLAAELCAVLAAAAYRFGDGALAHCALDRTLGAAPSHRLGLMLRTAVDAGLPPESLRTLGEFEILADRDRSFRARRD